MMREKLGHICKILNGFAFKSSEYVSSGVRIIRIANVQKGYIDDSQPAFYPIDTVGIERFMLEEGDLLLSLTGNVGRVAILHKEMLPAALNQRVACLRVNNERIKLKYLFHILNSSKFENDCILASNGVAQKNLSTEWLKEYEITVYEPSEQEDIVNKLDCILELLNKRKQQLAKLEELVKSQFIEMFDGRDGCEQKAFGDICLFLRNGANIKQFKGAGGYPITRIETLANDVFNKERLGYADIYDLEKYSNYLLQAGDILISHINSVQYLGRAVRYKGEVPMPIIHGMNLLCARIKPDYNSSYIEWCLKSRGAKNYIATITKKAVNQASITASDLKRLIINIPPREVQDEFARFVEQTDKSKNVRKQGVAA